MTYANLETEVVKRFREVISIEELKEWYQKLLDEYHKMAQLSEKMEGREKSFSSEPGISIFLQRRSEKDGEQCLPCNWSQSSDFLFRHLPV